MIWDTLFLTWKSASYSYKVHQMSVHKKQFKTSLMIKFSRVYKQDEIAEQYLDIYIHELTIDHVFSCI